MKNRNVQKMKSSLPIASFKHGDDKTKHSFQYNTSWSEIRTKTHMCIKLKSQISYKLINQFMWDKAHKHTSLYTIVNICIGLQHQNITASWIFLQNQVSINFLHLPNYHMFSIGLNMLKLMHFVSYELVD